VFLNDKVVFLSDLPRIILQNHPDLCVALIAAVVIPSFVAMMIIMQNEGNRQKMESLKKELLGKISWVK
jgi:hypothetical protein